MKKLEYICMAIVFALAGLSAMTWYGNGGHTWFWQVITMMWIAYAFIFRREFDKNNNDK